MHQTHSNKVIEIKKSNYKKKIIADAMITKMNDLLSWCINSRLCAYNHL
jgi:copper oxidase (laccase) domain-containing protein